jgi:hypothetical membrane protein
MFKFMGLLASVLFWVVTSLAIIHNPWFSLMTHAFSDLGGPMANQPWIYNYGLMITGAFALMYAATLIEDARNKVEVVGGAFMFIAGVFLALIGIYPSGTKPHTFVSSWFFTQADLAIITGGIGLVLENRKALGIASVAIGLLAPFAAALIKWPSVAILEAYGIILISAWIVLTLKCCIDK